jgi:hypothetical protein
MPIRPEHLFDAAQKLNALKPPLVSDEVCARTMANRAYYAAYLATREALRVQYANPSPSVSVIRVDRGGKRKRKDLPCLA